MELNTIELNLPLDPDEEEETAVLLRLHFYPHQGQAIIRPDDNGLWNHQAVRKAIYDHMPKDWGRYVVRSILIDDYTKVIVDFQRLDDIKELAEAWTNYLGGVITDPPIREV